MATAPTISEADILAEIVAPGEPGMSSDAARAILALKFKKDAEQRIRKLLRKNNQGKLTDEEQALLEKYLRVGQFLDLVQAKARLSLKSGDTPT